MSLDDWAVKNIEDAARKLWFGPYLSEEIDKRVQASFDRVIDQFTPGEEVEGIGDS